MLFNTEQPFALFENQIDKNIEFPFQLFFDPIEEIKTYEPASVSACLRRIQDLSKQSYFLVGYIAYEALSTSAESLSSTNPLLYFYAFANRQLLSLESFEKTILPLLRKNCHSDKPLVVYDFQLNETFDSYQQKISKIKEYQRQGDTYQVNFTMKNRFKWQGSAFEFFMELKKYQQVSQAAFLHFDKDICSYSPELFIRKDSNVVTSKPMKGTAPRGKDTTEDELIIKQMRQDPKIMSENLMIVDLIRNDLGRIALPGTVRVPKLFEVESYSTLHQMTSTVEANVDPLITFEEIIQALFPCGSITGAPKKSTMNIIRKLETEPRQLYTGALGSISPSGDFLFNVAIRTLVLSESNVLTESEENTGEMGIGSGIIYESDTHKEWEECLLKAKFIKMINSPIQLIETFRYEASSKNFLRLDLHLQRIAKSAEELGFNCSLTKIKAELEKLKLLLSTDRIVVDRSIRDQKIRLLLFQNAEFQITHSPLAPTMDLSLPPAKEIYKVICCKVPIQKQSVLQKHKTSVRNFYEEFFQRALAQGYDEILFFNEDSNCTEASRHNVVIKTNGQFLTPPVTDGALPGVFRQTLFSDKTFNLKEQSLTWKDLETAEEVYLCNSVRGLVQAKVFPIWLEANS